MAAAWALLPSKADFDKSEAVQLVGVRHFLREEIKVNEIRVAGGYRSLVRP
jgi:hypothetical protein